MIPSCESYNCQCERCENWHKGCCDTHKIECPQMGKLQEPCDGFKPKDGECKPDNESDFVKVVRCKDCDHVNIEVRDYAMYLPKQCELYCELDELPVKPDDFCSYGERKEED